MNTRPNKSRFRDLGVSAGDRVGIVGRNGDVKSTLMKLLVGKLEPDAGQVTVRSDATIGMLDQSDAVDTSLTVGRAIVASCRTRWAGDPKIRDIISGLVAVGRRLPSALIGGQRRQWPWHDYDRDWIFWHWTSPRTI